MTTRIYTGEELTDSEILERAADLMRKRGLMRGAFDDGTSSGPICADGAIRCTLGGHPSRWFLNSSARTRDQEKQELDFIATRMRIADAFRQRHYGLTMIEFNDSPSSTADNVADALLKLADALRESA